MPIFPVGQKLLASQLNDMNIERIVANSGFQTSEVGSFGSVIANSGFQTSEVGSFGSVIANSGFQTSEVGSFGSVNVSSWVKGPGLIVTGQSSLGSILVNSGVLLAPSPATPIANEAYRESLINAWAVWDGTAVTSFGGSGSHLTGVGDSFNILGIGDTNIGTYKVYFDVDFSSVNYRTSGFVEFEGANQARIIYQDEASRAVGSIEIRTINLAGSLKDSTYVTAGFTGDQ